MAKRLYLGDLEIQTGAVTAAADTALARFAGKKLIVTGDSITENNSRATTNWHDYLRDWLGFGTVVNDGKSGTGLTRAYGGNSGIYSRMDSWSDEADYILVMASLNDGGGDNAALPLGSIAESGVGISYFADCKAVVEKLLAKYPTVPIGFITAPPRSGIHDRGAAHGLDGWYHPWCEALKTVCAHYSLPCLDIYHNSGLRPWLAANNAQYFSCTASPQGDGIHPNAKGQEILARRIAAFVKKNL
ncbi:MAG TPA: SGNH/GDSL hydrolase family protein [Clostridia bacterium]|nr:SGNH/GDSL hydrolase family protein [Clostridia bacterium]